MIALILAVKGVQNPKLDFFLEALVTRGPM